MDDETREMLAQLAAAADQARSAMKEVAQMLGAFMTELMEAGFERHEAFTMCLTQLRAILTSNGE